MRKLDMLKPSAMCVVLLSALVPLIAQAPATLPSRLHAIMRDFEAEGFSGVVLVLGGRVKTGHFVDGQNRPFLPADRDE